MARRNQILQGREYIWSVVVVVVVIVIVDQAQNRIVSMITKLGKRDCGVRKQPAGYDDYDNDHDNDNESQRNASALSLENEPHDLCTLKQSKYGELMNPYLALRIDVDTYPGFFLGLPPILSVLAEHGVRASLFIPSGPDNSGLALARVLRSPSRIGQIWRLKPGGRGFLAIALAGILFPTKSMSLGLMYWRDRLLDHELVLHGHDHWRWLNNIHKWGKQRVRLEISRGIEVFSNTIGARPSGFGSPGWLTTSEALSAIDDDFSFVFSSDCRGESPFIPEGRNTPQLPTTLPTLEETIRSRIGDEKTILAVIRQALVSKRHYHSYCLHTEIEGLKYPHFLHQLLNVCAETGTNVGTLGEALDGSGILPTCPIVRKTISGRFDPVSWQGRQ